MIIVFKNLYVIVIIVLKNLYVITDFHKTHKKVQKSIFSIKNSGEDRSSIKKQEVKKERK